MTNTEIITLGGIGVSILLQLLILRNQREERKLNQQRNELEDLQRWVEEGFEVTYNFLRELRTAADEAISAETRNAATENFGELYKVNESWESRFPAFLTYARNFDLANGTNIGEMLNGYMGKLNAVYSRAVERAAKNLRSSPDEMQLPGLDAFGDCAKSYDSLLRVIYEIKHR